MQMATPNRPLSYEASKCILQYLPLEPRLNIRLRCPTLQTAESVVPLRINTLQIDTFSLRINNIEYKFTSQETFFSVSIRRNGSDRTQITNHESNITSAVNHGERRSLDARRSFLMHKLLGGRKCPVTIEIIKLRKSEFHPYDMENNLYFPKDLKMIVRHVEMHRVNELVLQQLSSRIIGDPLRSFRVIMSVQDPAFNCPLVNNAHNLHIPMAYGSVNALSHFPHKEITLTNGNDGQPIEDAVLVAIFIRRRQLSVMDSVTSITIHTSQSCKDGALNLLLKQDGSRRGVVDDVENNRFNIPCVCLPMEPPNELKVFEAPGITTETTIKVVKMTVEPERIDE